MLVRSSFSTKERTKLIISPTKIPTNNFGLVFLKRRIPIKIPIPIIIFA